MTRPDIKSLVDQLINEQQLPDYYTKLVDQYLLPLSTKLAAMKNAKQGPFLLGVNGGQGTGKSTMCVFIKLLMEAIYQQRCAILSIDDFYLSKAERQALAVSEHLLFEARGVPGTHDVSLAIDTIQSLLAGEPVAIPSFNKAEDDVRPKTDWLMQQEPVDIILFEGWCIGARAMPESELIEPINSLEREQDIDGHWRSTVNSRLASDYKQLFDMLDALLMLKAPNMEAIFQWRNLQERKLAEKVADKNSPGLMSPQQIERFIQHYERLTRYMLEEMPSRADIVFTLDVNHRIESSSGLDLAATLTDSSNTT